MNIHLPSTKILNTSISIANETHILEYIFKRLSNPAKKFYIVTPNPEILVYAMRSKAYQNILNGADVSIPDGIGVLLASKILNKSIIGRITGTDLMIKLCEEASKQPIKLGFLGGRPGVAEKTAECLSSRFNGIKVVFASDKWPEQAQKKVINKDNIKLSVSNKSDLDKTSNKSEMSQLPHIDILFVAFGAPKQEEWIVNNLANINVTCAMGVGGAFDYISGNVRRAPKFVRSVGFEWLFRLVNQPWRIRRQLALPQFAFAVLKDRVTKSI